MQNTSQPRKVYNFLRYEFIYSLDNGVRLTLYTNTCFFTGFPFKKLPTVEDVISRYTGTWDAFKARHVVYDDLDIIVKWGGRTSREEAVAMIKLNTMRLLAVPQVYAMAIKPMHDTQHGRLYHDVFIYMQYIRGTSLKEIYPKLTNQDKASIVSGLRNFLRVLRSAAMPPEKMRIQSCMEGPVTDAVFTNTNTRPTMTFANVRDFNQYLITRVLAPHRKFLCEMDSDHIRLPINGRIKLTHGNLSRANIIVSRDAPDLGIPAFFVGVVNWENAGWYPDFWEYTKAMCPTKEDHDLCPQNMDDDADWCTFWLPKDVAHDIRAPTPSNPREPVDGFQNRRDQEWTADLIRCLVAMCIIDGDALLQILREMEPAEYGLGA
ncbi:hypothetical protein KEM56_005326 [Ascosphaera pollenicola]|nr:hypothetical protein KEM56_005326 [Ascosphaera pollenicola]